VRKKLRLTQGAFARLVGVSRNTAIRYQRSAVPPAHVLDRIARQGGVTLEWLLRGSRAVDSKAERAWDDALDALRAAWRDPMRRAVAINVLRALRPPEQGP
jgi:transcriptional regulator with XRE-family HTH domain